MCNNCLQEQVKNMRSIKGELETAPRMGALVDSEVERINSHLKQETLDRVFIQVAKDMSTLSHCVSRQVGCVIVKDGRILATGINGTTATDTNCDELFPMEGFDPAAHRKWSDDNEIHAEMNAINFAAKHGISLDGATLYCSLQPCMQCSKNIPAVGIKRIVFDTFYDRVDNFDHQKMQLQRKGVIIEKLMDDTSLQFCLDQIRRLIGENDA